MTSNEIIRILERMAPTRFACDWDNVGLRAGRREKEVGRLALALEVNDEGVDRCLKEKVDMLVTYHPILFHKISRVNDDSYRGRWLLSFLQNDIVCYAFHTNFDVAPEGFSDEAADRLGLLQRRILLMTQKRDEILYGRGRYGVPEIPCTIDGLAEEIPELFGVADVKTYTRYGGKIAEKIAICTGNGQEFIAPAEQTECDVLICGGVSETAGMDAAKEGVSVIDVGPLGLEPLFARLVQKRLEKELDDKVELIILG